MKVVKSAKDKVWKKRKCCCCCSLRTGMIYYVIADFITCLAFFFYLVLFMSVDEKDFNETVISSFSIFTPFFDDDMSTRTKYKVVRNLLMIAQVQVVVIVIKTGVGIISWSRGFERRSLESYYHLSFTLYLYWFIVDIVMVSLK